MYKELKDYFPDGIIGNGIFTAISNISWFPGVKPAQLDTYFMLMHGEKLASKILDNFTNEDGIIEGENIQKLAKVIHNAYITNWEHEYKTLTVEYNPIENTDYVETYSGSASGTAGGSNVETGGVSTENDTYGLGSSTAAHDNKSTTTFTFRETTANAKSVLSVLGACVKSGDEIELICQGEDEEEALKGLVQAVESGLGEN